MTQGEKSSLAARKRMKEVKRTVPTGQTDPATGRPLTKRMSFYGRTREEAEEEHREHLRLLSRPRAESVDARPGTMAWWYLTRYAPLKGHLRPSSKAALDLAFAHLWREMGERQAAKVGAAEIAAMLARVGRSASLRNKVRGLALDLLELAAEEDPAVRPVSRRRVARAKERAPEIEVLTPAQARALALSVTPAHRPAVALMAFLGLRSGEAIAVLGGDLTPLGTLLVRRQDDGMGGWTHDLKTEDSRREIPIPADLYAMIAPMRADPAAPLSRSRGGGQIQEAVLRRAVASARRRVGLPPCPRHTLHSLRHGASTWLATHGCPEPVRKAILGQSRAGVGDRYVHATPAAMLPHLEAMFAASGEGEGVPKARAGGPKAPARGMRNGRAKVDGAMREEILRRLESGEGVKPLARALGVSPKTIRNARASTGTVVAATTPAEIESPCL